MRTIIIAMAWRLSISLCVNRRVVIMADSKTNNLDNHGVPMALHRFQELMGCSRTHLWRLRKDKILKTVQLCGQPYIHPDDLRDFNERLKNGEFANLTLTE